MIISFFLILKEFMLDFALSIFVFSLIAIGLGLLEEPDENVNKKISFFFSELLFFRNRESFKEILKKFLFNF